MERFFDRFEELLTERLQSGAFTTEDSVRYTFYRALLSNGFCSHLDVVIEAPHPALERCEIDTVVHSPHGEPPGQSRLIDILKFVLRW